MTTFHHVGALIEQDDRAAHGQKRPLWPVVDRQKYGDVRPLWTAKVLFWSVVGGLLGFGCMTFAGYLFTQLAN